MRTPIECDMVAEGRDAYKPGGAGTLAVRLSAGARAF